MQNLRPKAVPPLSQEAANDSTATDDLAALQQLSMTIERIRAELEQVIVGQTIVIDQLLTALLAGGHCLLVGVPGLAKTLLISSLAKATSLDFQRIQFTPDLMPADITGTEVIQEDRSSGERVFRFVPGPIFANLILADEINRTPPKTQAALLEAMQEHQVTAGGRRHKLPSPFFVLATQNPIEQEGTYPLPEAQLDRFMFNILVDYPSEEEEVQVVLRTTSDTTTSLHSTISGENLIALTHVVRRIAVTPSLAHFATNIARATRPTDTLAPEIVKRCVRWGAGPRASQYIVLGAKARAAIHGSPIIRREDVIAVASPVLRHRVKLNFQAEAENISVEQIISEVISHNQKSVANNDDREPFSKVLRS